MKADIAREPLQNARQLVERTSVECRCRITPIATALPIRAFELMLYIEQPDSRSAGEGRYQQLNEQIRFDPHEGAQRAGHRDDGEVHPMYRASRARGCGRTWETLIDHEQVKWRKDKQHKRIA